MEEVKELKSLKKRLANLSSIIKVNEIINSTLNLKELLATIMEISQEVMRVEAASLMLKDEKTGELIYEVALGEKGEEIKERFRLKKGQGIAGWVAEKEKPLLVPDVRENPRFDNRIDQATGFKTRSILAVPMKVKGKLIGVLEAINPLKEPFGEEEIELFTTFANQAGIAIENARLHQFLLDKQRVEEELRIARLIQKNILPKKYPIVKGTEFWARNIPAEGISGDFYDFIELSPEEIGIVIGDICGKGIPAALSMAKTIGDFRVVASLHNRVASLPEKLSRTMTTMNNILAEGSTLGLFATLIYSVLNTKKGTLTYVNAGHPLPLIRHQTAEIELLNGKKGLPLGIFSGLSFEEEEIKLKEGDLLLLYTDG
ncbi:MAG: SpoIIE family protein phosphatase, partial [Candidatus Omnitrophica bacterium]|nr:SpoIIE family protein phosphatase [Candidatus Omnitrophota bacterium]